MKTYTIEYYENGSYENVKEKTILSNNKKDAYFDFVKENNVYAAWVARVTYKNGTVKEFNTFAGNPF